MKYQCQLCDKDYTWVHDLKRHIKTKHAGAIDKSGYQQRQQHEYDFSTLQQQQQRQQHEYDSHTIQQQQQQQQQQQFTFKHPFTCIVSGPTSCGKTYFLVELLQQAQDIIQPAPQRIIWLYKRWQPLYDIIKATVVPKVEFIKGVPLNLDRDDFIDPRVRNVIVLDDMATEASKDQRVTDLYTEGSHHRNLSVITLNQNLYFTRDPTQRRNSHYLILFNNPVDKQPVATLARQMYPTNPRELLRHFDEAVNRRYGYLLVDLKPTTPEALRLRTDIFAIKEFNTDDHDYLPENPRAVQTYLAAKGDTSIPLEKNQSSDYMNRKEQDSEIQTRDTMPSCDDCGVVFENNHDLQKHVKRWCPEQPTMKREASDEDDMPIKRRRFSEELIKGNELNTDSDRENAVYEELAELSMKRNEDEWQQKVDTYKNDGLSTSEATEKGNKKFQEADMSQFVHIYGTLIGYMLNLGGGYLHTKIMDTIEAYITRNLDQKQAIRLALRKYKHFFEEYIQRDDENTTDDNDTDYSENNDETESDSDVYL